MQAEGKSEQQMLVPTVLWAQRKNMVLLRVQIQPLEKPDFAIRESYMTFKGQGVGLTGQSLYGFELVFYEPINTENCRVKFSAKEIEFRLLKKEPRSWPRVQSAHQKPHWIHVDFEHFEDEEDEEEEEKQEEVDPEKRERIERTRAQLDELKSFAERETKRYDTTVKYLGKFKTGYLLVYNGIQWSCFILVVVSLLKLLRGGLGGIQTAYEVTAPMLMFCQGMMLLEIAHAVFGLVRSGIMAPALQVLGRFLILFVVLRPAEEIHEHPIVYVLFLVWSLIELIRYPYYALSVINYEVKQLTWLRYTAWIPLYPLGFTCEATVCLLAIPHFEKTGDFSYPLPNILNVSFYPAVVLKMALVIIPLIAYNQITHMFAQRKKKLAEVTKRD